MTGRLAREHLAGARDSVDGNFVSRTDVLSGFGNEAVGV